jgi:hypothetical protein
MENMTMALFKCGHKLDIRLHGNPMEIKAQQDMLVWTCECHECAVKRFGGYPEYTKLDLDDDEHGLLLPKLKGSPKQVRWALALRHQMLDLPFVAIWHLLTLESRMLCAMPLYKRFIGSMFDLGKRPTPARQEALYVAWLDAVYCQTDAGEWIANRNNFGYGICDILFRNWFGSRVDDVKRANERLAAIEAARQEQKEQEARIALTMAANLAEKDFDAWCKRRTDMNQAELTENYWDLERAIDKSNPHAVVSV